MNPVWQALALEAGLAGEHLAAGVTAIGNANYAFKGIYFQAFFDLSIGFERAAKLTIILDYYITNNKSFPTNAILKNNYGHDLAALLRKTDQIAETRPHDDHNRLPDTVIHQGIIKTLGEFASRSRYYNLDYLTNVNKTMQFSDPLKMWFENVITPILKVHCNRRQREKLIGNAKIADALLGNFASVHHQSEDGRALDTVFDASLQTGLTEFGKPFSRMYVMQITRFLAFLISHLSHIAMKNGDENIPYLSEFFAIFFNDDKYFKNRKTWSIYKK